MSGHGEGLTDHAPSPRTERKPRDAGLRLVMSILGGLPPEFRFLRARPNVKTDRVGLRTRLRTSVRAYRRGGDGRWDGCRSSLGYLQLNNPFPRAKLQTHNRLRQKKDKT
jgi:hypothetical protein